MTGALKWSMCGNKWPDRKYSITAEFQGFLTHFETVTMENSYHSNQIKNTRQA